MTCWEQIWESFWPSKSNLVSDGSPGTEWRWHSEVNDDTSTHSVNEASAFQWPQVAVSPADMSQHIVICLNPSGALFTNMSSTVTGSGSKIYWHSSPVATGSENGCKTMWCVTVAITSLLSETAHIYVRKIQRKKKIHFYYVHEGKEKIMIETCPLLTDILKV